MKSTASMAGEAGVVEPAPAKGGTPSTVPIHATDTRRKGWMLIPLLVVIAYFPLFLNLDAPPVRLWDEARYGVSAYEMYVDGNYLVPQFMGEPDMWGVKPPLLLWCVTFFNHLLGPGELALRLPAALAGLFIGWLIFRHCWRHLERPWIGLLACAVLYSSHGILHMHGARSGDQDVPAALFMCWSLFLMHRWCDGGRRQDVLFFFIVLAAGTLTKSVQALLFLPGLAIYLMVRRKLLPLLRDPFTWAAAGIFVAIVGVYYLGREVVNPGYLEAVWENEVWGRYSQTLEGHEAPWDHYLMRLIEHDLPHWYMLVPMGVVLGFYHRDLRLRNWTLLLAITAFTYLIVISMSATKLNWYTVPAIPLLAGLAGIAIYSLFSVIILWFQHAHLLRTTRALPFLFLFVSFARPWSDLVGFYYRSEELPWEAHFYRLPFLLQKAARGDIELDADVLVQFDRHHSALEQHLRFYMNLLNEQGVPLRMVPKEDLQAGDRVVIGEWHVWEYIAANYEHEITGYDEPVHFVLINGPRTESGE